MHNPHLLPAAMKIQTSSFESLGKGELYALCDRLLTDDADAIEACIGFIEATWISAHGTPERCL